MREAASVHVDGVSRADAALDETQAAAETDVPQAEALIADLAAHMEYHLRKLDAPSRRRMMRRYGFKFYYNKGEARDPDDAIEGVPPARNLS